MGRRMRESRQQSSSIRALRINRRRLVQATGAGVLSHAAGARVVAALEQDAAPAASGIRSSQGPKAGVSVFPPDGTVTASPATEISFRGVSKERLGPVRVSGAQTGGHSGLMMAHQDGQGVSFVPDAPFAPGEEVTVSAGIPLSRKVSGELDFQVAIPRLPSPPPDERVTDSPVVAPHAFRSRPDLAPPVIEVLTDAGDTAPGLMFLAPRIENGQSGVMIADANGEPVWFLAPDIDYNEGLDFKVQEYRGQPVLTWWEGAKPTGYGLGHYLIYNTAYEQVAAVQVGNGYHGVDLHELVITRRDTAIIGVYNAVEWDLTPYGGPAKAAVLDQVVQEVEIGTGRVLLEWHALDHIAIDESYRGVPKSPDTLYDYVHLNSIDEDEDGNIFISCRHLHSIVKFDRATGEIMWRLNGKASDFEVGEGAGFAYQHDARTVTNGQLSLLDNGTDSPNADTISRGIMLDLDLDAMTAALVHEYPHPTAGTAFNQANLQVLPNGNAFIGWGPAPEFSEFGPEGDLRFNARLPEGGQSYRAFRFPWVGNPAAGPDVATAPAAGNTVTVYASWNGATEVAHWRVLAGPDPEGLRLVRTAPRDGFETAMTVQATEPNVAVEAVDRSGQVLGRSEVVSFGA
jgi:hypothetical protein